MIEHPGDLKPGDRVVLTVTKVDEWRVQFGGGEFTIHEWLRDNADLLSEHVVDVDRLRKVVAELRAWPGGADYARVVGYARAIESCLPPTEPPYTDPKFHPGMLVQAENGTGPMWLYNPDDDEDTHPFHRVKGPWYTRSELPDRLRVVYIDADGHVRPVKEKP